MSIEVVVGTQATIHFDAQKCIHSRHCVLSHPDVFVPNVQGAWIHPDAQPLQELIRIGQACPSGAIRVTRFVVAHDCGLIINPAGLTATIQANVVQTLSRTMREEVKFSATHVTSADWATYPISRASDVPPIDVVLVNHPELPSTGAGEPSTRAVAAAIANAVFDATGVRLRQVPFTPERVKAALA